MKATPTIKFSVLDKAPETEKMDVNVRKGHFPIIVFTGGFNEEAGFSLTMGISEETIQEMQALGIAPSYLTMPRLLNDAAKQLEMTAEIYQKEIDKAEYESKLETKQ